MIVSFIIIVYANFCFCQNYFVTAVKIFKALSFGQKYRLMDFFKMTLASLNKFLLNGTNDKIVKTY